MDNIKNHTIKKIDFGNYLNSYEQLYTKIKSNIQDEINKHKQGIKKYFYIYFAIAIYSTFFIHWSIAVIFYLIAFYYWYKSKKELSQDILKKISDDLVNKEFRNQKDIYREELGIINYIPENLEYEALKLITGIGHNYYSAETDLVTEAFKLSTDGIINVTLNSTSSTKVMGGANNTSVYSSIETTVHLQGMAIKLI